jgi:hypothetical protein
MTRNFKGSLMAVIFGLPIFLLAFIAFLYFGNCGFNNDCSQAGLAPIMHTPIPTIFPATMPVQSQNTGESGQGNCVVSAQVLLAAWVNDGYPETDPFSFTDNRGASCQATFKELQVVFTEANLWYQGALACISCHNADVANASANMDLSSYAGMIAGSRRTNGATSGNDIFGGGNWDSSKLNEMLFIKKEMPLGRTPGSVDEGGPVVLVGEQK